MISVVAALVAVTAAECGSSVVARARADQKVARFLPGMTFDAVRTEIQPPSVIEEYWGAPPRKDMGPYIVSGRDGRRVAVRVLTCDFDDKDRLSVCRDWSEPTTLQEITETEYETIVKGQSADSLVAKLCEPGAKRRSKGGGSVFEYWVVRPEAKVHKSCPAYFTFRKSRLVQKEMQCL
jgi:hypothetical protein